MDLDLAGRRALVTGASSGIGEAVAMALAAEGVGVAVAGRDAERTSAVASAIADAGGIAHAVVADLGDDVEAERLVAAVEGLLGGVDILVNAAGIFERRGWADTLPADWLATYNVDVVSMVRLIRLLIPAMRSRGWGRVINLASVGATMPAGRVLADYSAAKAAVVNLTTGLAKELAGSGVTANAVSPGDVETPGALRLQSEAFGTPESEGWNVVRTRLVEAGRSPGAGRIGTPEDIAFVVIMLASPRAGWITGTNVHVDGGSIPTVV